MNIIKTHEKSIVFFDRAFTAARNAKNQLFTFIFGHLMISSSSRENESKLYLKALEHFVGPFERLFSASVTLILS